MDTVIEKGAKLEEGFGEKVQQAAVRYLQARGYEIVARNWWSKMGVVPVIARDSDGTLVFVDIIGRGADDPNPPDEDNSACNRNAWERKAIAYMLESDEWNDQDAVRFDVIVITVCAPHLSLIHI